MVLYNLKLAKDVPIDKEVSVSGGKAPFDSEAERELAVDKEASTLKEDVPLDKDVSVSKEELAVDKEASALKDEMPLEKACSKRRSGC